MITDKLILRGAICLLTALLPMPLASCGDTVRKSAFEELSSVSDTKETVFQKYKIIYPEDASAELIQGIDLLCESLEAATDKICAVSCESAAVYEHTETYCIFVGDTEYTRSYYDGYLGKDYIFYAEESYAVLGGRTDGASLAAMERLKALLGVCEAEGVFSAGSNDFEYRCRYELDGLLLCGLSLEYYGVVCTEERTSAIAEIAEYTYGRLAEKCGAYAKIKFGAADDGTRELVFCKNPEQAEALIRYDGEDIIISAPDAYGVCIAAQRLLTELFGSVNGNCAALSIDTEIRLGYTAPTLSLGAVLSDFLNAESEIHNASALIEATENTDATVLYFGAVGDSEWNILKASRAIVGFELLTYESDGKITALAYRAADFQCMSFSASTAEDFVIMTLAARCTASGESVTVSVLAQRSGGDEGVIAAEAERLRSEGAFVLTLGNAAQENAVYSESIKLAGVNAAASIDVPSAQWELSSHGLSDGDECRSLTLTLKKIFTDELFE